MSVSDWGLGFREDWGRRAGVTVWALGGVHRGAWAPRFWSSPGCLFHHAYPPGYRASKAQQFGRTFAMSIAAGPTGPVFQVHPHVSTRLGAPLLASSLSEHAPARPAPAVLRAAEGLGRRRWWTSPVAAHSRATRPRSPGRRSAWRTARGSASLARACLQPVSCVLHSASVMRRWRTGSVLACVGLHAQGCSSQAGICLPGHCEACMMASLAALGALQVTDASEHDAAWRARDRAALLRVQRPGHAARDSGSV